MAPVFPSTSVPPDSVPAFVPDPSPRLATPLVGRESAAWVKDGATAERRWKDVEAEVDLAFAEVTVRRVDDPVANLAMLEEARSEPLEERVLAIVSDDALGVAPVIEAVPVVDAMLAAGATGREDPEEVEMAEGVDASEELGRVDASEELGRADEAWSATLEVAAMAGGTGFESDTVAEVDAGSSTDEVSVGRISELVSGGGATLEGSAAATGAEEVSKGTDEDEAADGSEVVMGSAELVG